MQVLLDLLPRHLWDLGNLHSSCSIGQVDNVVRSVLIQLIREVFLFDLQFQTSQLTARSEPPENGLNWQTLRLFARSLDARIRDRCIQVDLARVEC